MNTVAPNVNSDFKTRLRSAIFIVAVVLTISWLGGLPFILAVAAVAGIAGFEWSRMVLTGHAKAEKLSYLSAAICAVGIFYFHDPFSVISYMSLPVFIIFYLLSREQVRLIFFGIMYICFSLAALVSLRYGEIGGDGFYHLSTVLFCVWASDTFAYFSGRAIGGPKLAPKISPKKTWAGFAGAAIGAGAAAYVMALPDTLLLMQLPNKLLLTAIPDLNSLIPIASDDINTINNLPPVVYAFMGIILGMVGQAGDLSISYFKRRFGVKDTGTLIPGHGGILDRIDALMLAGIVFWFLAQGAIGIFMLFAFVIPGSLSGREF